MAKELPTGEERVVGCDPALPPLTLAQWRELTPGDMLRIRFKSGTKASGDLVRVVQASPNCGYACVKYESHPGNIYAAAFSLAELPFEDQLLTAFGE